MSCYLGGLVGRLQMQTCCQEWGKFGGEIWCASGSTSLALNTGTAPDVLLMADNMILLCADEMLGGPDAAMLVV